MTRPSTTKVIHHDKNGKIIKEERKGRGRPRGSWEIDDEGNYHAYPAPEPTPPIYYVHINEEGERHIETKKQGPTRNGYKLQADGEWKGHYVRDERIPVPVPFL